MTDRFQAAWPVLDDTLTLQQLQAIAIPEIPELAARHGVLVDSTHTTWDVADADTIPGVVDSPTGLVLTAVMPAVKTKIKTPLLEALNWPTHPPLHAIEDRHDVKRNTLSSMVKKAAAGLKPDEAKVCMSKTYDAVWRLDGGVLRPVGVAS